jgi:hypothetical protein
MLAYADYKQLDRLTTELFIGVMRELDEIYLEHLRNEQKRKSTKG